MSAHRDVRRKEPFVLPDAALLPAIIVSLRDEYAAQGVTAYDIGNGHCEDFANEVLRRWIGDDWMFLEGQDVGFQTLETVNLIHPDGGEWDWDLLARHWGTTPPVGSDPAVLTGVAQCEPNHIWITTGGQHYDVDHPEGVDTHFELMFFRRWIDTVAGNRNEGTAP